MGKCITKEPVVMRFGAITGETCYLTFGYNTKFDYTESDKDFVNLKRNMIEFQIRKEDFEKMFKIIN